MPEALPAKPHLKGAEAMLASVCKRQQDSLLLLQRRRAAAADVSAGCVGCPSRRATRASPRVLLRRLQLRTTAAARPLRVGPITWDRWLRLQRLSPSRYYSGQLVLRTGRAAAARADKGAASPASARSLACCARPSWALADTLPAQLLLLAACVSAMVQRCDGEVDASIHVGDRGAAANRCWRWSVRRSVRVAATPYDA